MRSYGRYSLPKANAATIVRKPALDSDKSAMDTYSHVLPNMQGQAVSAMESALS